MPVNKKKFPTVDPASIPEVVEFEQAKLEYEQFKEANAQFFEYLTQVSTKYNDALKAAKQAVQSQKVSCGEFQVYQQSARVDADAAYDILGRDAFLEHGGKEETVRKRSMDRKRLEMAIESGKIDEEAAATILKVSPRYRSKEEIQVP